MSADPGHARNPYRPGAAVSPLFLAGRVAEQRRFRRALEASPDLPANIRLTGLRGVGKTVLLKAFERTATEDLGWLASRLQVEPRHNTDAAIGELVVGLAEQARMRVSRAARLRDAVGRTARRARPRVVVRFEDVELTLDPSSGAPQRTVARALFDAAVAADEHDHAGYLLMLDEAQILRDELARDGQHPLSLLIAALNSLQERDLPIALVLCGLPTLRTHLLRARTYSERMFRGEEISSLAPDEARAAFERPLDGTGVGAHADLVARVAHEVEGYPFFIQLWGAELWDAARLAGLDELSVGLLDAIQDDIYRRLDADFYAPRVEALRPAEQDLLAAAAACPYPPLRTADIRGHAGKSSANVNVLMGRLVEEGVLFRTQKGQYEYTAPRFHEYLRRRHRRDEPSR